MGKRKRKKRGFRKALLRQPAVVRTVALCASFLLRLWLRTMRYAFRSDFAASPAWMPCRAIYVFWHENLLFPAHTHVRLNVATLVSQHRDGELLAQIVRLLGGQVVRGSTRRGGLPAVRAMIRQGKFSHLALAPDGPKGPRRVVQPGVVFLAARTGMPIIPMGFAYGRCWRARNWDKLALPHPGSFACGVVGQVLQVPESLTRDQLETCRLQLQSALDAAQAQAESLASGAPPDRPLVTLEQAQAAQPPADLPAQESVACPQEDMK